MPAIRSLDEAGTPQQQQQQQRLTRPMMVAPGILEPVSVSRQTDTAKWFPVIFVWLLILSIYGIYMSFHLVPALDEEGAWPYINLGFFNLVFIGLVTCYLLSIVVSPGNIPSKDDDPAGFWEYASPQEAGKDGSSDVPQNLETKRTGDRRHCKWCWKYKPDRCHHCRVCRTCVLRMDHHCPWIYNCVGFRNHKYFILLLVYATIACHTIMWTMFETVRKAIDNDVPILEMFCLMFGQTLTFFLGVLVTLFLMFHAWLTFKAMTTIEFCEKQSKKGGAYNATVYDRGPYRNICAVLGDNPLLWFVPLSLPSGDGLTFIDEMSPLKTDMESGHGPAPRAKKAASEDGNFDQHSASSSPLAGAAAAIIDEPVRAIAGTGSAPSSATRLIPSASSASVRIPSAAAVHERIGNQATTP